MCSMEYETCSKFEVWCSAGEIMRCSDPMCLVVSWPSWHAMSFHLELRRGLGKGWEDPNAAPFFVGIETIQRVQPMVFVLECALLLKYIVLNHMSVIVETIILLTGVLQSTDDRSSSGRRHDKPQLWAGGWARQSKERPWQSVGVHQPETCELLHDIHFAQPNPSFPWVSDDATKVVRF